MDILYLGFANHSLSPLPSLQQEDNAIHTILMRRANLRHYLLHRDSFSELATIRGFLARCREHLSLFHFSGHADSRHLIFENETGAATGVAQMLGQCPMLKLVFLNGCSTQGHVGELLQAGVPVVIATSAPVGDERAAIFSTTFYRAIESYGSIQESFGLAAGAVQMRNPETPIQRGIRLPESALSQKKPVWGIFYLPENKHVLDWKLPDLPPPVKSAHYVPNKRLVESLWQALASLHPKMQAWNGAPPSPNEQRQLILNGLPAPLAEPMRRLLAPVAEANKGYDKVSLARLQESARAYQIMMELLAFTLLAQLWEMKQIKAALAIPAAVAASIRQFLWLEKAERATFGFIPFIRSVREWLEKQQVEYFVDELEDLKTLLAEDEKFRNACEFMENLRQKLLRDAIQPHEWHGWCQRTEESLAEIYSRLGFLTKYTLVSVHQIAVQKYRHQPQPSFDHTMVKLKNLLGGKDEEHVVMERFTCSRSVMLLKMNGKVIQADLNLSPFLIDDHAFADHAEEPDICFLAWRQKATGNYFFKSAHHLEASPLDAALPEYAVVQAQLEAFEQMLSEAQTLTA